MKRSTLAARLMEARTNSQRKKLLVENRALADVGLARMLKDECYRVWTSAPAGARAAAAALKTLTNMSPSNETHAMRFWVEGIADITAGKLESAIDNLGSASRSLSRLGFEHESAQPKVAKLIALAMLGRYEQARRTGQQALKIFERYDDQLAAGKIEMNLSNIVSRRDQYRLAEQYCLSAYKRFEKLGETGWQTMAENGLANSYAELNDFARAEKFYSRALERALSARMHVTVAEIEASIGNLALFRGRYAEAIRWLEGSRQKYEKLEMPHQTAIAELEIADIYAELNLNDEAIGIYRRLIPILRRLKMRAEEARARSNYGRVLSSTGDFRQARSELKRAATLFTAEKNPIAAAAVALRLASLEAAGKNYRATLEIAESVSATLAASENVRLRLAAIWLRGDAMAELGDHDESEKLLERVLTQAERAEQPAIAQAAMNSLGQVARKKGNSTRAEKFFEAAIRSAEAARDPLPGEEFRMAFLAKMLEPYENLARLYLERGKVEEAFVCLERSRARSLLEGVASRTGRATKPATKLREELNWYYMRLDRASDVEAPKLQKEVHKREKQLAASELRAQSLMSRRSAGKSHDIDVSALQKKLDRKCALIEFAADGGNYSAFVITADGIVHIDGLGSEAEILSLLEGLHFQFGSLRFGVGAMGAFAKQIKTRADSYLKTLYDKLMRPLVEILGDRDLVIVPAGTLHYVPFHALFDGDRYVIESREVTYSPSAAVWQELRSRRPKAPKNALLMAYADERIPLVNSEVDRLSRVLPGAKKFTGRSASFSAFQANAPDFDLIHLACHGQFRPDNPMFSSLHLADGWVTVRDICVISLNAALVTLSACETGINKVFAGEEILGLARGFLSAGARSLILSLWTVNDEATTRVMADFYENLQRGRSIAASLRVAQINFIKSGEHPYYWSPFFLIG